ncbi:carbohydrate ABC transporter substrate-binding protein (CUT1 family) [Halanaerobium saccharolyticum]|uniref:Carbohydrate ABC transporter substrate-binding protein (CUT1 family) n=1 Tax=Halanaerobium saccharolyticum TaxID=43595 RepID=A0A4R7ZCQ0_9FIRM|nr:ABC transporter substrate-binding protein [Halanaerobium saccharolyticum]RAK12525.1 carbohydrate ABC transporter substrate-binding protein (CUT1 family) [Halanaerobium saccharolyticum]TDW06451.1 carbohydrate ABC transporter substrate-binding protein (CUT1 family) [Halanaerobium saccharolyticum]TDX61699.1 carbohydrate ABC transporter substrate-binding protein (CUT1 family) [Halanaerobium saccharolyticum]
MKKIIFFTLILLLLSISVSAQTVELTFWNGFTGPDREYVEGIVNKFNEEHQDIEVKMEIMPWDSFFQKLLPSLAVGQGPDIAGMGREHLSRFADAGVIAHIDDFYNDYLAKENLPPSLYEAMRWEDKVYAAPMTLATAGFYYNKELFAEAGLGEEPPENWDQLFEYARKLTKDTTGDGKIDQYGFIFPIKGYLEAWSIVIWGNNGRVLEDGEIKINEAKAVETIKRLTDAMKEDKISPFVINGVEGDQLFASGKAAMYFNGPWAYPQFENAGIDFGVAAAPENPAGESVNWAGGTAMVLNKNSLDKKEAAYKFFEYWNSKESQIYFSINTGSPPTRTDIPEAEFSQKAVINTFSEISEKSRFPLNKEPEFSTIISDVIHPALERILYDEATAQESLDQAAEELEKFIE